MILLLCVLCSTFIIGGEIGRLFNCPKISVNFYFVLGMAVWTLVSSFGYQYGLSPRLTGNFLYLLTLVLVVKSIIRRLKLKTSTTVRMRLYKSVSVVFSTTVLLLAILLPALQGGINFRVFQGNHWDQLSYLGITQSVSMYSFRELASGLTNGLSIVNPVTILASNSIFARPNVEILMSSFASPLNVSLLENAYYFQLSLLLILYFSMIGFIDYFIKIRRQLWSYVATAILPAGFIVGFWGQYLLDINAWSALSVAALILSMFVFLDMWLDELTHKSGLLIAFLFVSMAILYPEATLFMLPFYSLSALITVRILRLRIRRVAFHSACIFLVAAILLTISEYRPISFMWRQFSFGNSSLSKPWAYYFQAYLVGPSGDFSASVSSLIGSVPLGLAGVYFIAPFEADASFWQRSFVMFFQLLLLFASIVFLRSLPSKLKSNPIRIAALLSLVLIPYIAARSSLWTAGKAFNYFVPIYFCLIVISIVQILDAKEVRLISKAPLAILIVLWTLTQAFFAFSRVVSVAENNYPHVFPYVSIQDTALKSSQDWRLDTDLFEQCDVVELNVIEPFQNYYLQIKLNEIGAVWYDKNAINSYFGVGSMVGQMNEKYSKDLCQLVNEGDDFKKFIVHKAER